MLLGTVWALWAEAQGVVLTDVPLDVTHWAMNGAKFAKAMVVEWTVLILAVAGRCLVTIHTLLSLEAVAFLLKVAANWHSILLVDMQVLAFLPALTLLLQPMHAYNLFKFRIVCF